MRSLQAWPLPHRGDWLGKEPESNNCSLDTAYFETGMKGWKILVPYSLSNVYCTHFGPYSKLLPRVLTRIREKNLFISQGSPFAPLTFVRVASLLPLSSLGLLLLPGSFVILNRNRHNPVYPITTGINPIRNMNRKRKDLLNRSQEYQLQYLSAKEESCL